MVGRRGGKEVYANMKRGLEEDFYNILYDAGVWRDGKKGASL